MAGYIPRRFTCPRAVIHPSTVVIGFSVD